MEIFILLGEKSAALKDIDLFCNAFEKNGMRLTRVMAQDIDVICSNKNEIYVKGEKRPLPDAVISAYFGNMDNNNLYTTQMFESLGVLCINSVSCLMEARDKLKSFLKIKQYIPEILLPQTILYKDVLPAEIIENTIGYPLVVKIVNGSKGTGVEIAYDYSQAISAAKRLSLEYNDSVMLQKYISSSKGMDLRFIICGGKYVVSFIRSNSGSFISNVAQGGNIEPYNPSERLISIAEKVAALLDINLGSVDFLFGENNELFFCEANAMPGLNYTEAFVKAGLPNPMDRICADIKEQIIRKK